MPTPDGWLQVSLGLGRADAVGIRHQRDEPTLHTIGLSSRLKLRIRSMMYVHARRQTRCGLGERALISPWLTQRECVQRTSVVECKWLARRVCLGLFEYLGDVGRRHGAVVEAGFETVESEGCQHQQPGDERDEQPRHIAK